MTPCDKFALQPTSASTRLSASCSRHGPPSYLSLAQVTYFRQNLLDVLDFSVFLSLVRLDIQHGRRWYVLLYSPMDDTLMVSTQAGFSSSQCSWPQGYCSPWFSSCVFILCVTHNLVRLNTSGLHIDYHVLRPGVRLHQPDRPLQQVKSSVLPSLSPLI